MITKIIGSKYLPKVHKLFFQLTDPGMEHTGAREMSIRKAEAAILCYSSMSASSYHQLSSIADDFKQRKGFKYVSFLLLDPRL